MNRDETVALTSAMARSGVQLDWSEIPGIKVDKHSTGGVGDKTSLVVAPLVAACGGVVPMMSGRGLGHTGGTLDKLESIPGFRTNLSVAEVKNALRSAGCALIGQSIEMVPADRKLYALRDVTATVECIPLIAASIMSKKVAEGANALVLDVKAGRGGFMKTEADARTLARTLVSIGTASGVHTQALITSHDRPLGCAVGNAVEVIECIEVLKGHGPRDVVELSFDLSERMLMMAKVAGTPTEARAACVKAISSGRALEKFGQIIEQQGGDPRVIDDYGRLPQAPHRHSVTASMTGLLTQVDAELVGRAAVRLGAGRDKADDSVDPAGGFVFVAAVGEALERGDPLVDVFYRDRARLDAALPLLMQAIHISQAAVSPRPLIIDEIE